MDAFLVYELHSTQRRGAKRGAAGGDDKLTTQYTTSPVGCFFADDATKACELAAEQEGRIAEFLAVKAQFPRLEVSASVRDVDKWKTDQDNKRRAQEEREKKC